ncbi:unnamed protein product [Linum trigynum]|uniref:Uncharacterized protein n=1 Tax=Linum trigynum TaxID=586398 RepID=A0AAV2GP68_9ROSI
MQNKEGIEIEQMKETLWPQGTTTTSWSFSYGNVLSATTAFRLSSSPLVETASFQVTLASLCDTLKHNTKRRPSVIAIRKCSTGKL